MALGDKGVEEIPTGLHCAFTLCLGPAIVTGPSVEDHYPPPNLNCGTNSDSGTEGPTAETAYL